MIRRQIYKVKLSKKQEQELLEITRCGKRPARQIKRAQILLLTNEDKIDREIAELLHTTVRTVQEIRRKFCQEKMDVLKRKPVPGRPKKIDGRVEAEIMATALSDPPRGRARWTLQMIADQVVELRVIPSISHESVRQTLKKKEVKHWLTKKWKIPPKASGDFAAQMEDVLEIYEKPYDEQHPVICFDESNKQQIQDVIEPIPAAPGKAKRIDAEYKRNGTSNIFMIFEPLSGYREVKVTDRRTRTDFAFAMKDLIDSERYYEAEKITIVLDNLNIHSKGSLYTAFEPKEAKRIADRLEFHYVPKRGSWLNMAELELSALSRQCLKRRIKDRQMMKEEIAAWEEDRNLQEIKGHWTFTIEKARRKMKTVYPQPQIYENTNLKEY
jgi:DDE superfamily endonuclease/Homeodomain-like domain